MVTAHSINNKCNFLRPLQAVCRSLRSGFGCEWAPDQGGPAGVPGRDESSLPGHADRAVRHHEWTGLTMRRPMSVQTCVITTLLFCFFSLFSCMALWASSFPLHYFMRHFRIFTGTSFSFHSFLYFFSNVSSHYSCKKAFLLPAPHLSLTALCPLFLRLVCHVIKFLHKRHHVTLLPASPTLSFPHIAAYPNLSKSQTASLYLLLNFPVPMQAFYSRSCPDSSHKTTRNGTAQRLLNVQ